MGSTTRYYTSEVRKENHIEIKTNPMSQLSKKELASVLSVNAGEGVSANALEMRVKIASKKFDSAP